MADTALIPQYCQGVAVGRVERPHFDCSVCFKSRRCDLLSLCIPVALSPSSAADTSDAALQGVGCGVASETSSAARSRAGALLRRAAAGRPSRRPPSSAAAELQTRLTDAGEEQASRRCERRRVRKKHWSRCAVPTKCSNRNGHTRHIRSPLHDQGEGGGGEPFGVVAHELIADGSVVRK